MQDVSMSTWEGIERVTLSGVEASNGVTFHMPDGTWVELSYRKSDKTLSLTCSDTLSLTLVAANTCRVKAER